MRALFYGGAFNPVTLAHIELADHVRKILGFDKVVYVPSKMSYITGDEKKDILCSDHDRVAMLKACAETRPWMDVSEIELHQDVQPRTYITMCRLREEGYELKLLTGSDWLTKLQSGWLYIDEICHEFGIVMMQRNHDPVEKIIAEDPYLHSLSPYITAVPVPGDYQHISSTKVRTMIRNGADSEELLKYVPREIIPYLPEGGSK